MDVSAELAAHAARFSTATEDRAIPVVVDAGLMAAFDEAPTDDPEYSTDLESYLLTRSTSTTQTLLNSLFSLPTTSSSLGPMAQLPAPVTILPREKPLPKKAPMTKWERFAKEKGISHVNREKDVWDEESQSWVPRWGRGGKNREVEDVWIREIKGGEGADHDPIATARAERKARKDKNQRQQSRNTALAAGGSIDTSSLASRLPAPASIMANKTATNAKGQLPREEVKKVREAKTSAREVRKAELERSMLVSKGSTASMGVFDKKIEGEPKVKGVKRKFEPTSAPTFTSEKSSALSILSNIGKPKPSAPKKQRVGGGGEDGDVNVRKAMRYQEREDRLKGSSGGRGGASAGRGGRGGARGGGRGGKGRK